MKNILKTWLPSLIIMCGLGPIIGTLLISSFWGQPVLVISKDIAGIPILFYAYATVLPAVVPVSLFWCYILGMYIKREITRQTVGHSKRAYLLFSLKLGIICGFIFSIIPSSSALFSGEFTAFLLWGTAGILTGTTCSLLCFPFWDKQLGSQLVQQNINLKKV